MRARKCPLLPHIDQRDLAIAKQQFTQFRRADPRNAIFRHSYILLLPYKILSAERAVCPLSPIARPVRYPFKAVLHIYVLAGNYGVNSRLA